MRAIEDRLARPEERRLMYAVENDLAAGTVPALRDKLADVYACVARVRDRFDLPVEVRRASVEVGKGLSELWVALQESDSKRLRGFGPVDPGVAPVLDPEIARLARLMLDLREVVTQPRDAVSRKSARGR